MQYTKTFTVQAAHFNSLKTYETFWKIIDGVSAVPPHSELIRAFGDIHGHNFKIRVNIYGDLDDQGFIVDDVQLTKIVMEWDNKNLSTLPDFAANRERATTELMARKLRTKLYEAFPNLQLCYVTVHETDDIYAAL